MENDLPVEPGSLVDGSDDIMTSCSVKGLAGNRYRIRLKMVSHLDSEVTVQLFLNARNSDIVGVRKVNRSTSEKAVRLSNIEPGEERELILLVKGEYPVLEYFTDYRGFDGSTGGNRDIVEVSG